MFDPGPVGSPPHEGPFYTPVTWPPPSRFGALGLSFPLSTTLPVRKVGLPVVFFFPKVFNGIPGNPSRNGRFYLKAFLGITISGRKVSYVSSRT